MISLSTQLLFTLLPFHPLSLSLPLFHPRPHIVLSFLALNPCPQEYAFYSPFLTSLTLFLFPCYSVLNLFYPASLSNVYVYVFAPSVCPSYSTLVPSCWCCWPCPGPVLRRHLLYSTSSVAPTWWTPSTWSVGTGASSTTPRELWTRCWVGHSTN